MKWNKLGKIFDPFDYGLIYAQSPQALVFDDFIRIYFSTRQRDGDKYVSHIAFADFDKGFQNMIHLSDHTVIPIGQLGCFDEHGIFPMNVLRKDDCIFAFTSGWNRRVSVSVDTGIGLAISRDDGFTFQKAGEGPVLTASLHEPFLVGDPFTRIIDEVFHMWYIYGVQWGALEGSHQPERVYKIGHATSLDGLNWTKDNRQLIPDKFQKESQALPTVIDYKNQYHMFFCYRHSSDFRYNRNRAYRIGYAFSDDGTHWIRADDQAGIDVSEQEWDSDMLCYPHVFRSEDEIYLLYNGNEFGKYGFGVARLQEE